MLLLFDDIDLQMNGTQVEHVQSCKYLAVIMDEKWSQKPYISNLLKKLGHHPSVFNRIFYKLDNKTCIAYFNGLVLPHLDYGDIVWGDQPSLKSEMDHLQAFQNKRILDNKISSSKALNSLQWIPLAEQRFAHQLMVSGSRCN